MVSAVAPERTSAGTLSTVTDPLGLTSAGAVEKPPSKYPLISTPPSLSIETPFVSRPSLGTIDTLPSMSHRTAADGVPEPAMPRTEPVMVPDELMLLASVHTTPSGVSNSGTESTWSWRFTHRAAK